jgi:hypothetical protein
MALWWPGGGDKPVQATRIAELVGPISNIRRTFADVPPAAHGGKISQHR